MSEALTVPNKKSQYRGANEGNGRRADGQSL